MKNIGILLHENDSMRFMPVYAIDNFTQIWRRMGFNIFIMTGLPKQRPPLDLLLVHVDLSVVPEAYLEYAAHYPVVLNGRIADIRKSAISRNLVKQGDGYGGPVIAKSNLNCAGRPEMRLLGRPLLARSDSGDASLPRGYRVFDSPEQVPKALFSDPDWVVERFLPEIEDGLYHIRFCSFLGERWSCARRCSSSPILTSGTCLEKREVIDPHPELLKIRKEMGFDYGKFDYVVHDDKVVLIDANKTVGSGGQALMLNPAFMKTREYLAEGIRDYF